MESYHQLNEEGQMLSFKILSQEQWHQFNPTLMAEVDLHQREEFGLKDQNTDTFCMGLKKNLKFRG